MLAVPPSSVDCAHQTDADLLKFDFNDDIVVVF